MRLTQAGQIVWDIWNSLPARYPGIELGVAVVMPNHFHGILSVDANPVHESPLREVSWKERRRMTIPLVVGYLKMNSAKRINKILGTEGIKLAKGLRDAQKRGEKLDLTNGKITLCDALEVNYSAVMVLGDDTLKNNARELVETVRNNVTIDCTKRETVRAGLRVMVKRILRKYGYLPDKQEKATMIVLRQAELIAKDWAG